jgi:SAM-dependent methyltransferase
MAVCRNTLARGISPHPTAREYFERLYAESDDPWNFESSEYESQKYDQSLRALPRQGYENAFEIGCSIGVFTAKLAAICARLLAVDVAELAIQRAKDRCRALPNVRFAVMCLPQNYPDDLFDLTVLSEVGYYLRIEELNKIADEITAHTVLTGHLLLVHWLAAVPGCELRGDDVHDHFLARPEWRLLSNCRTNLFRIDVLERESELASPL